MLTRITRAIAPRLARYNSNNSMTNKVSHEQLEVNFEILGSKANFWKSLACNPNTDVSELTHSFVRTESSSYMWYYLKFQSYARADQEIDLPNFMDVIKTHSEAYNINQNDTIKAVLFYSSHISTQRNLGAIVSNEHRSIGSTLYQTSAIGNVAFLEQNFPRLNLKGIPVVGSDVMASMVLGFTKIDQSTAIQK